MTALEAVKLLNVHPYNNDEDLIDSWCPCDFGLPCPENCPNNLNLSKSTEEPCTCETCWKEFDIFSYGLPGLECAVNLYQIMALRTEKPEMESMERLTEGLMGLSGEAGEAIDLLKKHKYQGHELERIKLALELGDVAWYLAEASNALGFSLAEILRMNLMKLKKRYPDGFDSENSINREEESDNDLQ